MTISGIPRNSNPIEPSDIPGLGEVSFLEHCRGKKGAISNISDQMASIAYSLGLTNDAEEYSRFLKKDVEIP